MRTVTDWLAWAREVLASVDSPALSARVLMEHALDTDRLGLVKAGNRDLSPEEGGRYQRLVERRAEGEPVAYLTGAKEFYGLEFEVGPGVLIPRPETELMVDRVLERFGEDDGFLFADLGAGSGALSVSLASMRPGAVGVAVEMDRRAAETARRNAVRHGVAGRVSLVRGDFTSRLLRPRILDACLSNPPYVSLAEYAGLSREVRDFEPRAALVAGEDGLDAVRAVTGRAEEWLKPDGLLFMEIGAGQGRDAAAVVRACGFTDVRVLPDLAGLDRIVEARKGSC